MPKMIVKDGIQYRPEDAERLGITDADDTIEVATTGAPVLRSGDPVQPESENKARTINTTGVSPRRSAAERKAQEKAAEDEQARLDAASNGEAAGGTTA